MGRLSNHIDIRRFRACLRSKLSQKINFINHQYNFARILTRHATISRFSGARTKIFGGTPPKSPRMCACVRVCRVRAASQCAGGRARAHSPLRGSCEPLTSFWLTSVIDDDGFVICKITDDVRLVVAQTTIQLKRGIVPPDRAHIPDTGPPFYLTHLQGTMTEAAGTMEYQGRAVAGPSRRGGVANPLGRTGAGGGGAGAGRRHRRGTTRGRTRRTSRERTTQRRSSGEWKQSRRGRRRRRRTHRTGRRRRGRRGRGRRAPRTRRGRR